MRVVAYNYEQTHTRTRTHTRDNSNEDNHVNTKLIKIGVAMQPEALVAGMKEFYDKSHIHFEDSSI